MAKDFAIIWTSDKGYWPGTNATLNALEFYGNNVDAFVLTWGDFLSKEYKQQWPNVKFVPIKFSNRNPAWQLRFADIIYCLDELFTKYKSVLIWGADVCLTSNIMDYFDIAASTSKIILGTNEHGSHSRSFSRLSENWPYRHTWEVPFADVPFFVPSDNTEFLNILMSYQDRHGNQLSKMDGLNYAIRDCDAKVIGVSGEQWVHNVPYKIMLREDTKTKIIYFNESSTIIHSFHRKYWNSTICRNYLPGSDEITKKISRSNKMLFNRMYNFFNRNCRVQWTEGLEVWDGE